MMVLVVVEYDGKHAEVLEVGCMGTDDRNQG